MHAGNSIAEASIYYMAQRLTRSLDIGDSKLPAMLPIS
jgi:hypothetical protein